MPLIPTTKPPVIIGLARDDLHRVSKQPVGQLRLVAGLGVRGDAHAGLTMQHRSRWVKQRTVPNLRQVHLIHAELFEELAGPKFPNGGFAIAPAQMGENVTTRGIDLLALSAGTRLRLGAEAVIELTGLRNPCFKLNGLAPGLMDAVLEKGPGKSLIRRAGVMAIVITSGDIAVGDPIEVVSAPEIHLPLIAV